MGTPLIRAENVGKTFERPQRVCLFQGIHFSLHAGETVACTGRSGEGKSTLMHILGGIEPASEGALFVDGRPLASWPHGYLRNRYVGFIFQSFHLLEDLDVLENVLLPVRMARHGAHSNWGERGRHLLAAVGLSHKLSSKARWLSGGEKQRVAIARALVMDPRAILADEPTGNLDSSTAALVTDLLFEVIKREGKALFLVTHQQELAARCSRQCRLHQGTLIS